MVALLKWRDEDTSQPMPADGGHAIPVYRLAPETYIKDSLLSFKYHECVQGCIKTKTKHKRLNPDCLSTPLPFPTFVQKKHEKRSSWGSLAIPKTRVLKDGSGKEINQPLKKMS